MRTPEDKAGRMTLETDDSLSEWVNCPRCPGCFTNQYGRVRACIPPDTPARLGPGPLHPPMGVAPLAPDLYEATKTEIRLAYIAGQTLTEISRDLNSRGVPTRQGKFWHPSGIRKVVLAMPRAERMKRDT